MPLCVRQVGNPEDRFSGVATQIIVKNKSNPPTQDCTGLSRHGRKEFLIANGANVLARDVKERKASIA